MQLTRCFLPKGYICDRGNLRDHAAEIPKSLELRKDAAFWTTNPPSFHRRNKGVSSGSFKPLPTPWDGARAHTIHKVPGASVLNEQRSHLQKILEKVKGAKLLSDVSGIIYSSLPASPCPNGLIFLFLGVGGQLASEGAYNHWLQMK